jgi:chemosensory pili system protein ChpA (sensor histidine kinase/response regulator)
MTIKQAQRTVIVQQVQTILDLLTNVRSLGFPRPRLVVDACAPSDPHPVFILTSPSASGNDVKAPQSRPSIELKLPTLPDPRQIELLLVSVIAAAPSPAISTDVLSHKKLPELTDVAENIAQSSIEEIDPSAPMVQNSLMPPADPVAQPINDFMDMAWLNEHVEDVVTEKTSAEGVKISSAEETHAQESKDVIDLSLLSIVMDETDELVPDIEAGLIAIIEGNNLEAEELHRKIHTLKGAMGMVGSFSTRSLLHDMETKMEDWDVTASPTLALYLQKTFDQVKVSIAAIASSGTPVSSGQPGAAATPAVPFVQPPKAVRVQAAEIDTLIAEVNDARLANSSLLGQLGGFRAGLEDLENNSQRISIMLRELDMHAESQIQSRRTQLAETGEDFDPLELDRFTRLQELSRLLSEGVSDIQEVYREMSKLSSDQETMIASQRRVLHATQKGLHRTRLTPFDAINDRLYGLVWKTAREVGKEVEFVMTGGRVELDRILLEKIVAPLDHILRNAIAHGIEEPITRATNGKRRQGTIEVQVRQEAGRVLISVRDDGAGIQVERVRQKAVAQKMWPPTQSMDDKQAASMICLPGFSTAETITQTAGRGVGMDVVRAEILAMGGRFDLHSVEGAGLVVAIQLPTSIATAAVLIVEGGGESWALPIDSIEHLLLLRSDVLQQARSSGVVDIELPGEATIPSVPFVSIQGLTRVWDSSWQPSNSSPVVLARDGDRWMAIEVSRLHPVVEAPLRPVGRPWSRIQGFAGAVMLADGRAVFLLDPFRMPHFSKNALNVQEDLATVVRAPLVLVVDDSVTVRKATERFLSKHGIASVAAKDGQEALEILAGLKPDLVLLDVEMPRMDGFVCAKNIRESARHHDLPIVMITSRTAAKHRQRAMDIGVNEYLGKPFNEEELLSVLERFIPALR